MNLLDQIKTFLSAGDNHKMPTLIVVLGPTASGKTRLSLKLAHLFNGEIINADSRQIYRYMDIGTDKLPVQQQEGIRHHLYDIVNPNDEFTVADYKRLAIKTIEEIRQRGKVPILCGGTGLYISAVVENYQIPEVPPQPELREKYENYLKLNGADALHQLLSAKDPSMAEKIHPNNVRYVIRGLEVNEIVGSGIRERRGAPIFNVLMIGIDLDRELLYERINRRVDELVGRGLVNEVKTLLMKGYNEKLSSMSSLGYPEIIAYTKGEITLQDAAEEIKKNTRNYAKRQMTWFRRYHDVHWISGTEVDNMDFSPALQPQN
jgi:tRNA dimethylallyltransferase